MGFEDPSLASMEKIMYFLSIPMFNIRAQVKTNISNADFQGKLWVDPMPNLAFCQLNVLNIQISMHLLNIPGHWSNK